MRIKLGKLKTFNGKQVVLLGLVLIIVITWVWLIALPEDQIVEGVWLKTIDLGGRTKTDAIQLIGKYQEEVGAIPLTFIYDNKQWPLVPREAGFYLNAEEVVAAAFNIGRSGGWWHKATDRLKAKIWGAELPLEWLYNENQVLIKLAPIIEEVERPPVNAMLQVRGDQVEIIPGENGWVIDEAKLLADIISNLKNEKTEIQLVVEEKQPAKTTADISSLGIDSLLGKFTTSFNINAGNRVHNIKLAANSIDGLLISPGNVFSFNEIVGPRTEATGYKEAPVIVDNQLTTGLGGGICQVSSTLYNAVLLANLPVLERRRHSLQVDYIAVGVDATVVYGYVDLKFENNTDSYLLLKANIEQNRLIVKVFGNENFKKQVEIQRLIEEIIEPEEVFKVDQSLIPGETVVQNNGKQGYRTKVIRLIREQGSIVFEEVVSEDLYPPEDKVVLLGPDE